MRIVWTPAAITDLDDQIDWIATHDLVAALAAGDAVRDAIERLSEYPTLARPGRVAGTRELVVVTTPYVVVHRVEPDQVVILRVLHGARRWPPSQG